MAWGETTISRGGEGCNYEAPIPGPSRAALQCVYARCSHLPVGRCPVVLPARVLTLTLHSVAKNSAQQWRCYGRSHIAGPPPTQGPSNLFYGTISQYVTGQRASQPITSLRQHGRPIGAAQTIVLVAHGVTGGLPSVGQPWEHTLFMIHPVQTMPCDQRPSALGRTRLCNTLL
ncbi:hypothetical protein Bbelb_321100 [Branchiostoma belcheri]|nr:hypothetical protein Bbelb_321100 [Branchiostoma belcheri]